YCIDESGVLRGMSIIHSRDRYCVRSAHDLFQRNQSCESQENSHPKKTMPIVILRRKNLRRAKRALTQICAARAFARLNSDSAIPGSRCVSQSDGVPNTAMSWK